MRTDVRRMGGLEADVETLLGRAGELEERVAAAERAMVKRMAELLASSIDRVSGLKSTTGSNAQRLDLMRQRIPELQAADAQLSERIVALESSRARLMRTVTFAGDLKPKVFTIQRDFSAVEPRLDDLTLRIGQLATDLMQSERDIGGLRDSLASLGVAQGDVTPSAAEHDVPPTSDPSNQFADTANQTEGQPISASLSDIEG